MSEADTTSSDSAGPAGSGVGASGVDPARLVSGAPEAGGATSRGSSFGGASVQASLLRAIARVARSVEAGAYRRLRDMDRGAPAPTGWGGRPHRVRGASPPGNRNLPNLPDAL